MFKNIKKDNKKYETIHYEVRNILKRELEVL